MKRSTWQWSLICMLFLLAPTAPADPGLSEAELKATTQAFLEAKNARQQPNSTEADVDHFLSFLADEFVDEHIKFNVVITDRAELRRGMIAKLDDEIAFSELTIDNLMVGWNVAFVQYTEHARGKPAHLDEFIEYTATNLMALEFDGQGKITHIRRYHGL